MSLIETTAPAARPLRSHSPKAPEGSDDDAGGLEAKAHRALADAREGVRTLERLHAHALRRAMAAELSPELVEGRPCDVCGSNTHPAPATAAPDVDATRQALAAGEHLVALCLAVVASMPRPDSDSSVTIH
ncbi:MAG: hypothetical protein RL199_1009 [Pseudomonadota bacterium]|jgi:exonuclease SbcC